MESIDLIEATLQDVDRIMEMETEGFAPGNRERPEVYAARIRAFPLGSLMAYLGTECVGCFFSEIWRACSTPAAVHFQLGHDIHDSHVPELGTELYISSMTINPAFRGRGLGSQLFLGGINHVATAFPKLTSAVLLVNETWEQARKIYETAGFKEEVRLKDFFTSYGTACEDGIVMRRPIFRGSLSVFPGTTASIAR